MNETKRAYLGRDRHGFGYYYDATDGYVYNRRPDGTWAGYVCKMLAWERSFCRCLVPEASP